MVVLTRRSALQLAGAAAVAALHSRLATGKSLRAHGYGSDPSMADPRATWPRILSDAQRQLFAALCDVVLPAEGSLPSASQAGVHDFLDEWLSAPYPSMQRDYQLLTAGAGELDRRMQARHDSLFAHATAQRQLEVFSSLFDAEGALRNFAVRTTNLIAGGYYTTAAGYADMGYAGNRPLAVFPEPAPAVAQQIDAAVAALAARW